MTFNQRSHTSQATFYIFEQYAFLKSQRLNTIEYVLLPQNGMNTKLNCGTGHKPIHSLAETHASVSWCVGFCATAKSTTLKVVGWGGVEIKRVKAK